MRSIAVFLLVFAAPVRAERFTLQAAIAHALEHHPQRRVAEAGVGQARAEVELARANALPSWDIGGTHLWLKSAPLGPTGAPGELSSTLGITSVTLPLVEPRAWARWAEANEDVEVAEENVHAVRRRLALAAGRVWTQVSFSRHVLEAREEALRTAQAHLDYVQARRAQGAADEVALVRARQEQATAAALVAQAHAQLVRAREALGVTLGLDEAADIDEATVEVPEEAEWAGRRFDVERATLTLRARHTETMLGFVDYLPSVSFVAQGFLQDVPTPTLPVTGGGYIAQIVVKLPLFDGGRRYGAQHHREALEVAARAALEDARRTSLAEARSGAEAEARARDALTRTTQAAEFARQALQLTEERFRSGVGTDLDVIDALRESRDADLSRAMANDELLAARLDTLAATGQLLATP